MKITLAAFKGGVGKTTSAIHIAAYLSQRASTLLVDGDPGNRSALVWARAGKLPFTVLDEISAIGHRGEFKYTVIDTKGKPEEEDLEVLVRASDFLIIPTLPDTLSLASLMRTLKAVRALNAQQYKVLVTMVPPPPIRRGEEAFTTLAEAQIPVFKRGIRRYEAFYKAVDYGVPVSQIHEPNAREGWSDYVAICEELLL